MNFVFLEIPSNNLGLYATFSLLTTRLHDGSIKKIFLKQKKSNQIFNWGPPSRKARQAKKTIRYLKFLEVPPRGKPAAAAKAQ